MLTVDGQVAIKVGDLVVRIGPTFEQTHRLRHRRPLRLGSARAITPGAGAGAGAGGRGLGDLSEHVFGCQSCRKSSNCTAVWALKLGQKPNLSPSCCDEYRCYLGNRVTGR